MNLLKRMKVRWKKKQKRTPQSDIQTLALGKSRVQIGKEKCRCTEQIISLTLSKTKILCLIQILLEWAFHRRQTDQSLQLLSKLVVETISKLSRSNLMMRTWMTYKWVHQRLMKCLSGHSGKIQLARDATVLKHFFSIQPIRRLLRKSWTSNVKKSLSQTQP